MYMMNMFMLLIISMMMFIFSIMFFLNNYIYMLEWTMFNFNSIELNMFILLDWMSLMFSSMVLLISSMIYLYCINYMNLEKFKLRFNYLLMLFILSMNMMIFSPNIMSIMIGWDGLGLISFCLVIFYQNKISFKGGLLTMLCNRLGDIGLLMAISMMLIFGSWHMIYYNNMIFVMITLAAITKSAQMPFSIWLPAAMAAPTPISALVHSSTLVTAGIYLLIRYSMMLNINKNLMLMLFCISFITLMMSSIMALMEFDFKKIIALSTLNQMSLMMMSLSLNMWKLTFFHMITHAMFKSLLFLCAGIIIHSMNNFQDIRFYGGLYKMYPMTMTMFMISSLSLSGFPFMAGFYSKDYILENSFIYLNNLIWYILIISSIMTMTYSLRLIYYLFFKEMNLISINLNNENYLMFFSMNILFFMSIIMGSTLYWMYFFNLKPNFTNFLIKNILFLMIFIGSMLSIIIFSMKILKKIKNYSIIMFIYNMMNFNMLYNNLYMPFMNISLKYNKNLEKGWFELSISKFIINYMLLYMIEMKFIFMKMILLMLMIMIYMLLFFF